MQAVPETGVTLTGRRAVPRRGRRPGSIVLLHGALLALLLMPTTPTGAEAPGVDPEAARLLKHMTDFVGGQDRFSLETVNTVEVVPDSGQKIQFTGGARTTVQRPNKLHSERVGDVIRQSLYYDGRSLTLFNPDDNFYATVPAPPTIDGLLDLAREQLDIVAPAGHLITMDACGRLMSGARTGFVVGKSYVGGARCDHLALRGCGVDWQLWIEDGARPVPRCRPAARRRRREGCSSTSAVQTTTAPPSRARTSCTSRHSPESPRAVARAGQAT